MSKSLFSGVVTIGLVFLPAMASAAPFEFAGFYAGGHLGYMQAIADVEADTNKDKALMGGLQAGYNLIDGSLMYGLETDFSLTSADPDGACSYIQGGTCDFDLGPMATLRGRVGFATGDFLVFGTAGVAASRYDLVTHDGSGAQQDNPETFGKFGWTAGVGVEYFIGDVNTVKLEYRYVDLFDADFDSYVVGDTDLDMNYHIIMTGVNWHF